MTSQPDMLGACQRMRVYDLAADRRSEEEELTLATTAFRMGWEARRAGRPMRAPSSFADDSLVTDFINGWERADRRVRG